MSQCGSHSVASTRILPVCGNCLDNFSCRSAGAEHRKIRSHDTALTSDHVARRTLSLTEKDCPAMRWVSGKFLSLTLPLKNTNIADESAHLRRRERTESRHTRTRDSLRDNLCNASIG